MMLSNIKPPKFEIEDLCIPESDPIYPDAVRCVQKYWEQAADMTKGQCQKYLWYLQKSHIRHFVTKPFERHGGTVIAHGLYQRARDDAGNFVRLSRPVYLLLSSLYGDLPKRYEEAIAKKYGPAVFEDHTAVYRHFYETPTSTMARSVTESTTATTAQAHETDVMRETLQESTPSNTQRSVKSEDDDHTNTKASVSKDGDSINLKNRDSSSTTSETAPIQGTWNIDHIKDTLALPTKKRSSSAQESAAKRTKLIDDEILSRFNQQTEAIWKMIHEAQLEQRSKLQEVHHEVRKGVQVLNGMQNDLRQFMSAVASALKDIREHLNE
ncbi:hypothetical protein ACHAPX_006408 [Trichoderma viride]